MQKMNSEEVKKKVDVDLICDESQFKSHNEPVSEDPFDYEDISVSGASTSIYEATETYIPKKISRRRKPAVLFQLNCDICDFKAPNQSLLDDHVAAHKAESHELYECDDCSYRTTSIAVYVEHKKIHDEGTFKCDICGDMFNKKLCIKRHLRIHEIPPVFMCITCGIKFPEKSDMSTHEWEHLKVTPMTLHSTTMPEPLDLNIRKQQFKKPVFVCVTCGNKFKEESDLTAHQWKQWCKAINPSTSTQTDMAPRSITSAQSLAELNLAYEQHQYRNDVPLITEATTSTPANNKSSSSDDVFRKPLPVKPKRLFRSRIHKCDICVYITADKNALAEHAASHKSNKN